MQSLDGVPQERDFFFDFLILTQNILLKFPSINAVVRHLPIYFLIDHFHQHSGNTAGATWQAATLREQCSKSLFV